MFVPLSLSFTSFNFTLPNGVAAPTSVKISLLDKDTTGEEFIGNVDIPFTAEHSKPRSK